MDIIVIVSSCHEQLMSHLLLSSNEHINLTQINYKENYIHVDENDSLYPGTGAQ